MRTTREHGDGREGRSAPLPGRRLLARWAVLPIAAILMLLAAPSALGAQPPSGAEELNARVEASIVQLGIQWSGYVQYESQSGPMWSEQLAVNSACTGFFVSTTGHVMTAGHCVDPEEGRDALINGLIQQQVEQGLLTSSDAASILPVAIQTWAVEGQNNGSQITRTVQAVQPRAVPGAVLVDPTPAQVLDSQPAAAGDLALVKVEATNAAALPVAPADPRNGAAITSIGFPATVTDVSDANRVRASFISGTIASNQVSPTGVAQTEINATINKGMSGGPTIDSLGNVLGVNSFYVPNEGQTSNFITDTSTLKDWVTAKGVPQVPVRTDAEGGTSPGAGIPMWVWLVAGGVLLVIAIVLAVVLSRRRPAGPPNPGATAPYGPLPHTGPQPFGQPPAGGQYDAYGSQPYGSQAYGSQAYGPQASGPQASGPHGYGPQAYGPPAYGPSGAAQPGPAQSVNGQQAGLASDGSPDAATPVAPVAEALRPGECAQCRAQNTPSARFCSDCGGSLPAGR